MSVDARPAARSEPSAAGTPGGARGLVAANVVARVLALAALGISTVLVARTSGPSGVGTLALLRVLPGLAGVLISGGLPSAVAYFLARSRDGGLRATIIIVALGSGAIGGLLWVLATPLLGQIFFGGVAQAVVLAAGITVFTQLLVASAKGCTQGIEDLAGSNLIIVLEELTFLPAFGLLWAAGLRGNWLLVFALVGADVMTAVVAWLRLAHRHFLRAIARPSMAQAREIWWYGTRGQVGAVLSLVNLRLDFILLGAFASTAIVGSYAVASKFAELLRLPSLAITYVLYPRFSRRAAHAATEARAMLRPAAGLTMLAAIPLFFTTYFALPLIYGKAFDSAIVPAQILIGGLAVEGAAGVVTAFLYGRGRPGLNSIAMGVGVVVTVVLDILLIPSTGAVGAAVASCAAYLTTTAVLLWFFWSLDRRERAVSRALVSWRTS